VKRDLRPVIVAGTTAALSSGLLGLAVWRGWLGPDVGRGSNFCEAPSGWAVRQPSNSFSNLGFVVAGLLIAWHAGRPGNVGSSLGRRPYLTTAMACIIVLLGPASAAMHATQTDLGGHLDMLSMYLVASLAFSYALTRFLRAGTAVLLVTFASVIVTCEIVEAYGPPVPVVMTSANAAFGSLLVVATVLELLIMRRGQTRARRGFAFAAIGTLLVAFAIWNAANAFLCAPHSWLQGHAAWHLLDALAAYLLYRYYASEQLIRAAQPAADAGQRAPVVVP
jgi:hypothetical protein